MSTIVIAEAGVNHNGELERAKSLIAEAAAAGADVVKFQSFRAELIATKTAKKAEYQAVLTDGNESQYEMIRKLELSVEDHRQIIAECRRQQIQFLSTAFDIESFEMLRSLDAIKYIKVPSGEITNLPLLRHFAGEQREILISTGMANLGEIEAALSIFVKGGTPENLITLLHCTTEYPAPYEDVNLRVLETLSNAFGVRVGYSDHTQGIEIPIAAAALGASVIEKHFTLDRNMRGPDHAASLEPGELASMIDGIRNVELALGKSQKKTEPSELKNKSIARRSIVARVFIKKGQRFTDENLIAKRPGTGISPMLWDEVVGRTAIKDFEPDELIEI